MTPPALAHVKEVSDLAGVKVKLDDEFRHKKVKEWEAFESMGITLGEKPEPTPVPEDNDSRPTMEEVEALITSLGHDFRIFDSVSCVGTCDYVPNRVNITLSDDGVLGAPSFG